MHSILLYPHRPQNGGVGFYGYHVTSIICIGGTDQGSKFQLPTS